MNTKVQRKLSLPIAIDQAVEHCIEQNVLKDFLLRHRAEVTNMILEEFDLGKHIKSEKKISFEEGANKKLLGMICKKLYKGNTREQIAEEVEEDISMIENMIAVANKHAPEYELESVYESWSKIVHKNSIES